MLVDMTVTWDLGLGIPCEPALSVSISNHLHLVDVFCIYIIGLESILNSSRRIENFHDVLNLKQVFLKLNWLICNYIKFDI